MSKIRPLDLIEELRLRRWARENYVPAGDRNENLHPVILDEMQRRDAEGRLHGEPVAATELFSYHQRLDAMYGPNQPAPHFPRAAQRESLAAREMHYF